MKGSLLRCSSPTASRVLRQARLANHKSCDAKIKIVTSSVLETCLYRVGWPIRLQY